MKLHYLTKHTSIKEATLKWQATKIYWLNHPPGEMRVAVISTKGSSN